MPLRAALDFFLLSAIWGASFLFTQLAASGFGSLGTAFTRVTIGALVLLPLLLWRGLGAQLLRHWKVLLVAGMLNSGIPFALYAFAVQSISTGLSAILNATTPMFGALVAWTWLKDRPDRSRIVGLVVGFTGVALLAGEKASLKPAASGIAPLWAVLACLCACLCYGISASFTKRHLSGLPPLLTATGSQVGASAGLLLPAMAALPARMPSISAWAAIAVVGALCTGLAYILFFRLIEGLGPARALAVPFVVPVFAVAYGALLLDEHITAWMVLCGAVIVLGTALATGLLQLPARLRGLPLPR